MSKTYDFIVIGGGSAGYAAARTAVSLGLTVAVVEGGKEIGGLCIWHGCMPSKTLIESANRFMTMRRAKDFGLRAENLAVHADEIVERKKHLVSEFASHRRQQLETGGFDFIRGMAAFVDAHTIEIVSSNGEPVRLTGRTFLIATGSVENRMDIPGLAETGFLDSDAVLDSKKIPESVIVLGGGAIAMEFAHYYEAVGAKVTIIQRSEQVLKGMDPDIAAALVSANERRGMKVFLKTAVTRVERNGDKKRVVFQHDGTEKSVEAAEIVCALGRVPNLRGLHVERAGVITERGKLKCNGGHQTNVPHIFAGGDVDSSHETVHIAIQQGEIAARNAAKLLRESTEAFEETDYRLKLTVIFSEPQVASVGMTVVDLTRAGIGYKSAKYSFDDLGKSLVMGEPEGFVKLLVAEKSGEILGASIVGPHAADLIHEIVVAMYYHGTAADLARIPHYHPTLSEIWTYPAEELV